MISILIPFHNEEGNISKYPDTLFPIIKSIMIQHRQEYEYVFIDDGSSDKSYDVIMEVSKKDDSKGGTIHSYEPHQGLGKAIKTGIKDSVGDYIIIMDSDLSYRPYDTSLLLRELLIHPDADCITASPYLNDLNDDKSVRIFGSKFFNKIFSLLLNKKVTCVTGMFRLYKTSSLKELELDSDGFNINTEILLKLLANEKNVYEIPVKLYKRDFGNSKMKVFKEVLNETKLIVKLIFKKVLHKKMTI